MTITSIGSSFSFIRPETVNRATAAGAEAQEANESTANESAESERTEADAASRPRDTLAPQARSEMIKTQETVVTPPPSRSVAHAYAGH